MSRASRVRHAEGLFVRRTTDAVVVLGAGEEATIMRATAAEVWDACEPAHTVGEVLDAVAARYGVAGSEIGRDVVPFIEDLVAKELLVVQPDALGIGPDGIR